MEVIKMIHGLNDYDKFKVLRPILGDHVCDDYDMPIMNKVTEDMIPISNAKPLNIKNLSPKYNNSDKIVLPFNYDKDILKYWNDPMKYIPVLQTTMAAGTPDYSAYVNMNTNEIRHNVYKNRWIGCLWQAYGINAIPTVAWALPNTYGVCFSGIEKGGIVVISTIGCAEHLDVFYSGFYKIKDTIQPSLIIVFGDKYPEMYGRFINYKYVEAFNSNKQSYKQLALFEQPQIFERKGA